MDAKITESELLAALMTCSDSDPGSYGLSYSVYKKLWSIVGLFILASWEHGCSIGVMPPSHSERGVLSLSLSFCPRKGRM